MEYRSDITEIVDLSGKLRMISDNLKRTFMPRLASSVTAEIIKRVHLEGLATNLSPIGTYSTDPIYVNPEKSPRNFQPMGKDGDTEFQFSSNKRKTKYFKEGYKGFRSQVGRESGKVNLNMTGKLMADFGFDVIGMDAQIGFRSDYGSVVAEGNEDRFGKKIFDISKREEELIDRAVDDLIDGLI